MGGGGGGGRRVRGDRSATSRSRFARELIPVVVKCVEIMWVDVMRGHGGRG